MKMLKNKGDRNMKHSSAPPPLIPPGHGGLIENPTSNDVLCGRGKRVNAHIGNVHFRDIVRKHKLRYLATSKVEKSQIAGDVVNEIRTLVPPGRFLKADTKCPSLWSDIGDDKAKKKAGQALREDAPEFRTNLEPERIQIESIAEAQNSGDEDEIKEIKIRHGRRLSRLSMDSGLVAALLNPSQLESDEFKSDGSESNPSAGDLKESSPRVSEEGFGSRRSSGLSLDSTVMQALLHQNFLDEDNKQDGSSADSALEELSHRMSRHSIAEGSLGILSESELAEDLEAELEKDLEEIKKFVQRLPTLVQIPRNNLSRRQRDSQSTVSVDSTLMETLLRRSFVQTKRRESEMTVESFLRDVEKSSSKRSRYELKDDEENDALETCENGVAAQGNNKRRRRFSRKFSIMGYDFVLGI